MSGKRRTLLLGFCEVYCGTCTTFRAYNDNDQALFARNIKNRMLPDQIFCKGCGSSILNEWCSICVFRICEKERGVAYCFECKDFPCKRLIVFSKTRPHRTLGLKNLKQLKEISIEKQLRQQEKRWTCSDAENFYTGTVKNVQIVEQDS